MEPMRSSLAKMLSRILGVKIELLYPPPTVAADYASNAAFVIARRKSLDPKEVAVNLKAKLLRSKSLKRAVESVDAAAGFVNLTLSPQYIAKEFLRFLKLKKFTRPVRKKRVIVEYSSPNIGKPLSIAHIRSTIIGDSLARIFRALGWKVVTDNHLGDWGLQTGILIAAYKLWGKKPARRMTLEEFLELYVRFNREMKDHEELGSRARLETVMLQEEDPETLKIWQAIMSRSLGEYRRLYRALGVNFDYILGESFYRKELHKVIDYAVKKGVAQKSEGALVIPVGGGRPPLVIEKKDGGYLYGTFDLATIRYRKRRFRPTLMLYVISNEQALYLEQLFAAAQKLGWLKWDEAVHVKFGLIRGEDLKRLSTRGGRLISLEQAIREATQRARRVVEEKNPGLPEREKDRIAKMVGIGALKYNDLSQNRNTDIIFDWDRMLDFSGNSAPYLQYTYARLRSILRKAQSSKLKVQKVDLALLKQPEELALMKKVLQLPEAIEDAAKEYLPNVIANYLWELANFVNSFYEKFPVLKAAKGVREARLALVEGVSRCLREGLDLLGIEAPERV